MAGRPDYSLSSSMFNPSDGRCLFALCLSALSSMSSSALLMKVK